MHLPPPSVVSLPQPSSPPTAPSSVHDLVVTEPVALSPPPCGPVIAFQRERHARRDAEFAEIDEAFLARDDRVLELESSFAKATSTEAILCSQVGALQTDLVDKRADLTASRASIATATFMLDKLRADDRRLSSQNLNLAFTAESLRF